MPVIKDTLPHITPATTATPALLLVANWDSGVGYAWWLMESFWVALAKHYATDSRVILAYPSISTIPTEIRKAPITVTTQTFGDNLLRECIFLKKNAVRAIYFSDRPNYSLRYLAYRVAGVRLIIVHDHTPGVRTPPTGLKRLAKQILHRLPGIAADGYIGATDYVRRRFVEICCAPPHRCHSAPNGLPERSPPPPSRSIRSELGIPDNIPLAVMTGRANRYKNVSFVLKCIADLAWRGHKLHFLFCGDGPDLVAFCNEASALGIESLVTFAGRRNDIPQVLPQCDFALHPSLGEVGYSLSILEYMQAGLPVIVPDNPSVCGATQNGETGIVYREHDAESLAKAIVRLMQHPADTKAMGEAARIKVNAEYNLKNTHASLLRAFKAIDRDNTLKQETTS
jgi:glycosyltransferase involved in cell wall biosynthesis